MKWDKIISPYSPEETSIKVFKTLQYSNLIQCCTKYNCDKNYVHQSTKMDNSSAHDILRIQKSLDSVNLTSSDDIFFFLAWRFHLVLSHYINFSILERRVFLSGSSFVYSLISFSLQNILKFHLG